MKGSMQRTVCIEPDNMRVYAANGGASPVCIWREQGWTGITPDKGTRSWLSQGREEGRVWMCVVGVKMETTVPRAGLEPTSQVFRTSVLPLRHICSLMSPLSPAYAAPCLRGQCSLLHLFPWNCKSFSAYDTCNNLTCTCTRQVQQPYNA